MNTNQDRLTSQWAELESHVQQHWPQLTTDDLAPLNGTIADLIDVLRRRYGYGQAQAILEIDQWLSDLDATPLKS